MIQITATPAPTVTVTTTATPTVEATRESNKSDTYKIGDEIETSGRKIKVTEVLQSLDGLTSDNQYMESIPGRIIVASMLVGNTSSSTGDMTYSRFVLKDSQGRTYEELDSSLTLYSWKQKQGIASRNTGMFPGETRKDAALFRVPPDASGFSMEWKGNKIDLSTAGSQSTQGDTRSVKPEAYRTTSETKSSDAAMTINGKDYTTHVNLRSEPNTESSVVAEVHTGDKADYIDKATNSTKEIWYKVRVNGNVGWVYEDLVSSDND